MDFSLVQGIGDLIREDAGGEAGDDFFGAGGVGGIENIVVDEGVIAVEGEL